MSSDKDKVKTLLVLVSGRRKAKLTQFYYKVKHANKDYSLTEYEKSSFNNASCSEIAEKIYNLGQSNPRRLRKLISGFLVLLIGAGNLQLAKEDKLDNTTLIGNTIFSALVGLFFGYSHKSEKTIKRKRKALIEKLTMKNISSKI